MTSFDELQAYQKRLRTTIFHSADVLPKQVETYLREIVVHGSYREIEQALEMYRPLVDHLATAYVDFALEVLVKKPLHNDQQDITRRLSMLRTYHDNLGIRERIRCFPPSHIQGPFLYLLRRGEQEGLRLIQSLTNTAVEVWQERERDFYFHESIRSPLPIILTLPTGPHKLWGDERVYCWYRSSSHGPDIVVSALMALEVWLEDQVIAGRNPQELFEHILLESNCIAVAGICLSIALGFPKQCLAAALPLIASPAMWRLEVARAEQDRQRHSIYSYLNTSSPMKLLMSAISVRNGSAHCPFSRGTTSSLPITPSRRRLSKQVLTSLSTYLFFLKKSEIIQNSSLSSVIGWNTYRSTETAPTTISSRLATRFR